MNEFAKLITQCLDDAHETLEGIMNGVTKDTAHFKPQGKAIPVGAAYVHIIVSEDVLLNSWVRKEKTVMEQGWVTKMGLSAPHPEMDENWEKNFEEWYKSVEIDLDTFKEYAQAVYKESNTYLSTLTEKDYLEKKIDLSVWGLGEWNLAKFVLRFLVSHVDAVGGEISAAKGMQGLKGYPF